MRRELVGGDAKAYRQIPRHSAIAGLTITRAILKTLLARALADGFFRSATISVSTFHSAEKAWELLAVRAAFLIAAVHPVAYDVAASPSLE
jgi:hypothetical protein